MICDLCDLVFQCLSVCVCVCACYWRSSGSLRASLTFVAEFERSEIYSLVSHAKVSTQLGLRDDCATTTAAATTMATTTTAAAQAAVGSGDVDDNNNDDDQRRPRRQRAPPPQSYSLAVCFSVPVAVSALASAPAQAKASARASGSAAPGFSSCEVQPEPCSARAHICGGPQCRFAKRERALLAGAAVSQAAQRHCAEQCALSPKRAAPCAAAVSAS